MSITKNRQSREKLLAMAAAAFPGKTVAGFAELTEGMFNAAYRVDFADGSASVLKIAAADQSGLLANEINLMRAEVAAMQLCREHGMSCVPMMQYSDFTRTLCDGTYFFMELVPGRSLNSCREEIAPGVRDDLMREVGRIQRMTAGIRGERFGLLGDETRFDSLYEMLVYLFTHALQDAAARRLDLEVEPEKLMACLERDRFLFDEVKTPSLVHWDMWEGNIFVHEGKVSGVIDWERAMWGEPFMDDRFRGHTRCRPFLEGFGQTEFTAHEARRIRWYDLFLYITMFVESFYRQYADDAGFMSWITQVKREAWQDICAQHE